VSTQRVPAIDGKELHGEVQGRCAVPHVMPFAGYPDRPSDQMKAKASVTSHARVAQLGAEQGE